MDLIYYHGLNCRQAAIINIASLLGVNYIEAYSTLWSEINFKDEIDYNIFVSERIYTNFKTIGLTIELLDCEKLRTENNLSQISVGEFFVVGMDIFNIPWHPVYNYFHDRHFFFVRKDTETTVTCFDPVYAKKDIILNNSDILSSAFEISRISKKEVNTTKHGLKQEAREILSNHTKNMANILAQIESCKIEGKQKIKIVLKQLTAMINNRYLFAQYFHSTQISKRFKTFFDKEYLLKWEGVKNGLYKATALKNYYCVIDKVCDLFSRLVNEETEMAKAIIH